MTDLPLTVHARAGMRQRAIPPLAVEALLAYGRVEHDHHGGIILFFDKAARWRLERERLDRALEHCLDAYAVVAGTGEIITVGHRVRRIRRHRAAPLHRRPPGADFSGRHPCRRNPGPSRLNAQSATM